MTDIEKLIGELRERGGLAAEEGNETARCDARYFLCAADALETLSKRMKELESECFALAADQCHAGYAGENGDHRCKEVDEAFARGAARQRERDAGIARARMIELAAEIAKSRKAKDTQTALYQSFERDGAASVFELLRDQPDAAAIDRDDG